MQKLLTVANYKTLKGRSFGFETFGIHFAPANLSGYEVCQKRTKGCTASCLNMAGMGPMVQSQRIEKTKSFFESREEFLSQLVKEIASAIKTATKKNLEAVFRLNLTSDIEWENVLIDGKNLFDTFPLVQFYDYTKKFDRLSLTIPNYHLTFSRAESKLSQTQAFAALAKGFNSAFVFNTKKDDVLPTEHAGFKVIDGDQNDLRFLDPKGGVIVGLRAKGPAKKDNSGFVVKL